MREQSRNLLSDLVSTLSEIVKDLVIGNYAKIGISQEQARVIQEIILRYPGNLSEPPENVIAQEVRRANLIRYSEIENEELKDILLEDRPLLDITEAEINHIFRSGESEWIVCIQMYGPGNDVNDLILRLTVFFSQGNMDLEFLDFRST